MPLNLIVAIAELEFNPDRRCMPVDDEQPIVQIGVHRPDAQSVGFAFEGAPAVSQPTSGNLIERIAHLRRRHP